MRVIIDTNRVIASLIRDGISRKILFNKNFEFFSPDCVAEEIYNHRKEIIEKANVSEEEFEILLSLIFENISIAPREEYEKYLEEAKTIIEDIDDAPFIALCLAINADAIWSDDPHFLKQSKARVFKTEEIMKIM